MVWPQKKIRGLSPRFPAGARQAAGRGAGFPRFFRIFARDAAQTDHSPRPQRQKTPQKTLPQFHGSKSEVCPQKAAAVPVPAVSTVPPFKIRGLSPRFPATATGQQKTVVCPCHAPVHARFTHARATQGQSTVFLLLHCGDLSNGSRSITRSVRHDVSLPKPPNPSIVSGKNEAPWICGSQGLGNRARKFSRRIVRWAP